MAYKEKEIEKRYFSIGEVAEMLDVNTSLLRYWESEFSELQIKKDRNGVRLYTKETIEILKTIYALVKEKGYTIEGAKQQLKPSPESKGINEMIDRLKDLQSFLQKVEKSL